MSSLKNGTKQYKNNAVSLLENIKYFLLKKKTAKKSTINATKI